MERTDSRIIKNSSLAILYELIAVLSGLILPRLILVNFGSAYNGIISSITQFLSFAVLMRSGVGGVAKVHLYKTLKENDHQGTSRVMCAIKEYMDKVSVAFLLGLLALAVVYPFVVAYDWLSTALLVLICGSSSLLENYFGISSMILLQADRREYLISIGDIVVTVLNTILTVILIRLNFGVHIVKLGAAIAFSIKPVFLFFYVKRKYKLERKIDYPKNLLSQKKDAFIHVVSEFVHRNTAIIVLTIFVDALVVSVYSIYAIVINGMRKLTAACTSNIEAVLGKLYANDDKIKFAEFFQKFEYSTFLLGNFIYITCALLFCSFINVYTEGITDTEYIVPVFAFLLCVGEFFDLAKTPYQFIIRVAGHFKQTKWISLSEVGINVLLSLIFVHRYHLIGVAIGNAVAMIWRTIANVFYVRKNIPSIRAFPLVKYSLLTLCSWGLSVVLVNCIGFAYAASYIEWIIQALCTAAIVAVIIVILNFLFCRNMMLLLLKDFKRLVFKRI